VLKPSSGKKAKKCPFEAIDDTIYEKAAKMIAFKTTSYRLHPWIRATWLYYYDFFGCNNSYNIDWANDPISWSPDEEAPLKSICITVSKKEDNPLDYENSQLYKLTIYITTGLIEVQGNAYKTFGTRDFPILYKCIEQMLSDNQFKTQPSVHDCLEETQVKKVINTDESVVNLSNQQQSNKYKSENNVYFEEIKKLEEKFSVREDNLVKAFEKIKDSIINTVNDKITTAVANIPNKQSNKTQTIKTSDSAHTCAADAKSADRSNQETDSDKLKNRISALQQKNDALSVNIQQLKYDYELQLESAKSEIKLLKQDNQMLQMKLNGMYHDVQLESEHLRNIIKVKNEEISNLEMSSKLLRDSTGKLQDEILLLKMQPINPTYEPNYLIQNNKGNAVHLNTSKSAVEQSSNQPNNVLTKTISSIPKQNKIKQKSNVVLIGTSNVEGINPKQLSSKYETRKVIAYKLDDTLKVLKERDFSPNPRVVVLHSLTNSIKDKPAEECVSKLDEIVQFIHNKWSHCKVVISLATVRSDKEEHNNNVHLVNALVRTKFLKRENVFLCVNDNLAFRGKPISRFMNSDGYHLSE